MSAIIKDMILGVVQGLTEFLPVSSSGHLEIAKFVMGDGRLAQQSMLTTVVLHFATALSTVFVFRREIVEILGGLKFEKNEHVEFCIKILLSMLPAVFVGLMWEDAIELLFDKQLLLVGFMLIVTGVLLFFADRAKNTTKNVGYLDSLIIGVSQAIAILPGISRSGATISTSVLLGIDRTRAARFSFLMVVPLIFGKIAKDILDVAMGDSTIGSVEWLPLSLGFVAAFVTGVLACTWMIQLVKSSKLYYFSIYCFVVAAFAIAKGAGLF